MKRNIALAVIMGLVCMFALGSGADDEPEKRVMGYLAVMNLKCGEHKSGDKIRVF